MAKNKRSKSGAPTPANAPVTKPVIPSCRLKKKPKNRSSQAILPSWFVFYILPAIVIVAISVYVSPSTTTPRERSKDQQTARKLQQGRQRSHPFLFPRNEAALPEEIHAGHVSQFYAAGRLDDLHWALDTLFQQSARQASSQKPPNFRWNRLGSGYGYTTRYKLQHDLEQAGYLAQALKESHPHKAILFQQQVAPIYQTVLDRMPPEEELLQGLYKFTETDLQQLNILTYYNRALYTPQIDSPRDEQGHPTSLLHPEFNATLVQQQWEDIGIVVIDNLLRKDVLQNLYQIMLESTVFFQTKPPAKGKYVGAYMSDGLHDYILLELGQQMSDALPTIFQNGRHALNFMWAYKYDSDTDQGIHLHADEAAININIWLTPNEANLDPNSGGLVVYQAKPPPDWDFAKYNSNPHYVKDQLLAPSNYANITVPYRQNRCVLFDSALFHHTDTYKFKPGYKNRRINLTYLYGEMQKGT